MYVTERDGQCNGASEKSTESINKDDLLATLIAAKFAISIFHAKVIVMLAGIGGSAVQR